MRVLWEHARVERLQRATAGMVPTTYSRDDSRCGLLARSVLASDNVEPLPHVPPPAVVGRLGDGARARVSKLVLVGGHVGRGTPQAKLVVGAVGGFSVEARVRCATSVLRRLRRVLRSKVAAMLGGVVLRALGSAGRPRYRRGRHHHCTYRHWVCLGIPENVTRIAGVLVGLGGSNALDVARSLHARACLRLHIDQMVSGKHVGHRQYATYSPARCISTNGPVGLPHVHSTLLVQVIIVSAATRRHGVCELLGSRARGTRRRIAQGSHMHVSCTCMLLGARHSPTTTAGLATGSKSLRSQGMAKSLCL